MAFLDAMVSNSSQLRAGWIELNHQFIGTSGEASMVPLAFLP